MRGLKSCLLIGACLTLSVSCQRHADPKPLIVGVDEFVGFAPVFLARNDGLKVDPRIIPGTAERNEAFAAGQIDAICTTVDSLLLLAARGVPLTIVAAVDQSDGADGLLTSKEVKSIQDLRGRTVAFQQDMPSQFLLLWVLKQNGMRRRDVIEVLLDADKAAAAFAGGKVDAAVTWEPYLSKAVGSRGKILLSSKDYPGVLVDALAVRTDVFDRRRRDVTAMYQGWMNAVESIKNNPDRSIPIMSSKIGLGESDFKSNLVTLKLADRNFNKTFFDHKTEHSIWSFATAAVQIWRDAGTLRSEQFDPAKSISSQIVDSFAQASK